MTTENQTYTVYCCFKSSRITNQIGFGFFCGLQCQSQVTTAIGTCNSLAKQTKKKRISGGNSVYIILKPQFKLVYFFFFARCSC